jgi:general secretion pathway protein E
VRVRFRIDGALHDVLELPGSMGPALVSRIKIMGGMNIVERRRPQDGQITTTGEDRPVDIRVSTVAVVGGEKAVLRVLDKSRPLFDLGRLGMTDSMVERYKAQLHSPYGMVICAGPTGSGKTTTLYSALTALSSPDVNIVTIEDPIEMVHDSFNQIHANAKTGTAFAEALRHVLRQDPDVIMVGEVRDAETAEQAVQAALTGHLVLTTLHTNDSVGAIARMTDLGVPPFLLSATLTGVLAQRLVRKVCAGCGEDVMLTTDEIAELGVKHPEEYAGKLLARRGAGCPRCRYTGFYGRSGIFELLTVNRRLRQLIAERATPDALLRAARQEGLRTLRDHAVRKVASGVTSLDEAVRATADAEG